MSTDGVRQTEAASPTERLRALLDERGVGWQAHGYENHSWWEGSDGVGWHAENRPSVNGLYVKVNAVLTPEQAVEATLGRGTCSENRELMAENERLRELARDLYLKADDACERDALACHRCPFRGDGILCDLSRAYDRMRELGIEAV